MIPVTASDPQVARLQRQLEATRRISQALFQQDSERTGRKPGGTGLGTRIVKDVVDAHGGEITVESKENVGTTFRLRLPLHPPALQSANADDPEKEDFYHG